ncbi:MAG: hypothetical protein EVJ46_06280 [Candidatus Acididesulfobacter guangdongensis]|jgi:hypothetical protein|uniref:Uncharacterized protein n=1 Tax=Acididesulfobacter guangdongensis TaxID=2597225 RepID=A0A519BH66_ACIG2|nr:MAG: hypothetical protein EVJ46_06280 [Candidatus Acididesulfobacter guangdongensis]
MNRLILFYLNHDKLFSILSLLIVGISSYFAFTATAHAYIQPINPSTNVGSINTGATGILNTAITWVCYRLAPATTVLGIVKGLYDIKFHRPEAARKAFITGVAGAGIMIAPTIVNAIIGIVNGNGV